MAIFNNSVGAEIYETARQVSEKDDLFLSKDLYFFELIFPAKAQFTSYPQNRFLFPLIIPPESFSMEEPFAAEPTQTLGGSVYVET
jgi:hypothetical protein